MANRWGFSGPEVDSMSLRHIRALLGGDGEKKKPGGMTHAQATAMWRQWKGKK